MSSWLSFISDLFKAGFSAALIWLGRKSEKEDIEWMTEKNALDEANKAMSKQDKIRSKYAKLKVNLPAEWGNVTPGLRPDKSSVSKTTKTPVR